MSEPWKQIKIFTCDAEQSIIIEPNPERNGICIHSNEELASDPKIDSTHTFCLHASYDEALAIANELINFVSNSKKR